MELLERDGFSTQLAALLAEVRAGYGQLLLVSGEAGIGKTALLRAFCSELDTGTEVLWGACDGLGTPRPLAPLVDIARQLGGPLQEALDSERRDRVFDVFLDECHRGDTGRVVVIDDAHWADDATLDLLRVIGRRAGGLRALIVVAYRDDEVGGDHPLRGVLGDLTSDAVTRMQLPPLSLESVRTMTVGTALDADELHRVSKGNPFFVTEVARQGDTGVPASVRDAVLARVARLTPAARHVARTASVIGVRVEPWLLNAAAAPDPDAVDECVSGGLLADEDGMLVFRHELTRIAIYDAMTPSRRTEAHRSILASLRSGSTGADLARLARHADGAADREAVLTFARAAGDQAAALSSHREAAAEYARALRFAQQVDVATRAELLEARSYECFLIDKLPDAITARQEAIECWRSLGDVRREGESWRWLSRLRWFQSDPAGAWSAVDTAIELLETVPPSAELAMAYSTRSQLHMVAAEFGPAIEWGGRAVALADHLGAEAVVVHALNNIGTAESCSCRDVSGAKIEESLRRALAAGLQEDASRAMGNLANTAVWGRRHRAAWPYVRDAISFFAAHDLDASLRGTMGDRAQLLFDEGRWDEAVADAESVLASPTTASMNRLIPLTVLGRVRARRGDPDPWSPLDEALALAERRGLLQDLWPARAGRAEAAWLAGDVATTASEALSGLTLALVREKPWALGELAFWAWKAGALDDVPDGLPEPYALHIKGRPLRAAKAWAALECPFEEGLALADTDDERHLRTALDRFEALGARPAALEVKRRLRDLGVRGIPRGARPSTRANPAGLTAREVEVLRLLAAGMRNAEIADQLVVSPKTVDHHVSAVLTKLGVPSRAAAAREATRLGLQDLDLQDREPAGPT